jgi:hypothetical protein
MFIRLKIDVDSNYEGVEAKLDLELISICDTIFMFSFTFG